MLNALRRIFFVTLMPPWKFRVPSLSRPKRFESTSRISPGSQLRRREPSDGENKRNRTVLDRFAAILAASVVVFSVVFHMILLYEGQQHLTYSLPESAMTIMSSEKSFS